jgi:hypothetical protein
MTAVVYDAGVLIAADKSDRSVWAEHRVRLEAGELPLVPAAIVAQVSRTPRQAQLRRVLRGCEVVPLDELRAHRVGAILAASRTTDVVDGAVVELAIAHRAAVITSDPDDIRRLAASVRARLDVIVR